MGFLALFHSVANGRGRLWCSAAENSYGIYYVHALFVYFTAYAFIDLQTSIYLRAGLIFGLAIWASWAASAGVLRKAPILQGIF